MKTNKGLQSSFQIAALSISSLALQGCLTVKSYVDPTLPVISNTQLPKVQIQPRTATVLFEFRTKGNANARATSSLSGRSDRRSRRVQHGWAGIDHGRRRR